MGRRSVLIRWLLLTASWLAVFAAGVTAQRLVASVSMRGRVLDANTVPEAVEYWEVRTATGESVVITGRNDLAIIKWLHQAKNRTVGITIDLAPDASGPTGPS
jgi:hypothetical protein